MSAQPSTPVVVQRILPVDPDRAFDAWLEPSELRTWMAPVSDVEVDARVGGGFRIVMDRDEAHGGPIEHGGEYRELDRPRRLVFTWISPYTDGESVVTVDLAPDPGGTRLVLTHEGLPPESRDGHAEGWGSFLDAYAGSTDRAPA
jgi:uncharacterized protein YndB with AHSA1/START domain